jgi:hypothetical protein
MASMQTKLRRKQRRKPSGLPFVQQRKASEYRLTTYKCDATGELPSKKFMRVPTTIGDLPSLKPWEAEGISERTWYRRRAAAKHGSVAVLTAAPDTCHGCISHCQTANGSPTVAPTQPSRCHGSPVDAWPPGRPWKSPTGCGGTDDWPRQIAVG